MNPLSSPSSSSKLVLRLESSYVRVSIALLLALTAYFSLLAYFVDSYTNQLYELRKQELKRLVEIGMNAIQPIREQQQHGELSADQARAQGVELVRRMTYSYGPGNNYLFMSSYTGTMLVQPFEPEKVGSNQWNLVDANDKYIIRELVAVARSPAGSGYVEYDYPPPGSQVPQTKLSYVVGIPEWNCYVGTGMYLGDIATETSAYLRNSLLLTGGWALVIFGVIFIALRPLIGSHRTLLRLFEEIQRAPDFFPEVPVARWRPGSEGWRLLDGFQGMLRRIQASKRELAASEERLALVLQGTNDGFFDWDLHTQAVYYSPRWKSMLGYTDDELGSDFDTWRYLLHPDDVERVLAELNAHLNGATQHYAVEHRLRHKDGSYRWILARGSALRDAAGRPYRMAGSHTDITEIKQAQAQLASAYEMLERRVEERTRELATLNAISAVVSGSLDLKEILNAALDKAMATMRMEVGTAYSIQYGDGPDEDKHLVLAARRGLSAEFSERVGQRRVRGTAIQVAVEAQQPVVWLVANYPDPQVKQALEMEGVRQVINVPLFAKGKLVGAFNLGTRHERLLAPEEISLLASIGQQIAVAVENARLYDQAEQSAAIAERHRLSRELHDSVTQSLYSVTMYAEAAARLLATGNTATAVEHLRDLRDTAQEALREMRLLIFELRPPTLDKIGLAAALQARLDSVEVRGGMKTQLHVDGVPNPEPLSRPAEVELYHIAQEALNNVLKHAHAQHVRVHLRFSEAETLLEICDDGVGFTPAAEGDGGGLGLASLAERAEKIGAKLEIKSAPGTGTEVRVTVPISSAKGGDSGERRQTTVAAVADHT